MRPNPDDPFDRFNVVVIEDDAVMRLVIGMLFEEDGRFRICWQAGSADRALRLARAERRQVDLIILDDVLEGPTTGTELAPSLHRLWPAARVVMFTADPQRVPTAGAVVATVAKTAPELLLETARRIIETEGLHRDRVGPATPGRASSATAAADPTAFSRRRAGPRRHGVSALAGTARWAAVAAVLVALLAVNDRVPPPRRLVTNLAGFVADLLPEALSGRDPDQNDPPDEPEGGQTEVPASDPSDVGADGGLPTAPDQGRGGPSDKERPGDRGPASADEPPRPTTERPSPQSPKPAPLAGTPPVTPPFTSMRLRPSPATTAQPPEEAGNSGRQPGRTLTSFLAPAKGNGAPVGAGTTIAAAIPESPQADAANPNAEAARQGPAAIPEPG